jgi:hypothetical protein
MVKVTKDQGDETDLDSGSTRQRQQWIDEEGMRELNFQGDRHRETPVDLFVAEPFDFEEEYRLALVQEIAPGRSVHIVRLETLLRLKDEAGPPQDLADAAELRHRHDAST